VTRPVIEIDADLLPSASASVPDTGLDVLEPTSVAIDV